MRGVDAAGGFAYQHAQAIQLALRLALDETLDRIRVEAENDVVDAEVWSGSNELVEGFQYKRRNEKDTWGQQELIDELADWSDVAQLHPGASYHFVTDGRLGPTGRRVRDALQEAADGDMSAITGLMTKKAKRAVDVGPMGRAWVSVDDATYPMLIERAEQQAKALLTNVTGGAEAEERSRSVVLELLNAITERSGRGEPNERVITRDEVLQLLSTPQEHIPSKAWADDLKAAFHASVLAQIQDFPVPLKCRLDPLTASKADDPSADLNFLEYWIEPRSVCLLGGASGSGKSTVLLSMQRRAAQVGKTVIVAQAEDYIPGRLSAMIASGINLHGYIGAHPAVGTAALADRDVIVAIDGVSEVPHRIRQELESELRAFLGADQRATLVLAGRETTSMRSALTRNTLATDLIVTPLSEDDQQRLVEIYYKCGPEVALSLAREAKQKMQDVARNPLMLLLGVRAILLQGDAANPARVFETVVRSIADDSGYAGASVYEIGLGMAYSQLIDGERRYCDTFTWGKILNDAAERLAADGHLITGPALREFGSETGLVRVAQHDSVRPVHDSFADYLAAAAASNSMASLPEQLGEQDRSRARFLAQLSGVDSSLAALLSRDLPMTAVNVAPIEGRLPEEIWYGETQRYVDGFMPASVPRPRVAYWVDSAGRRVVTVDGAFEGWWEDSGPDAGISMAGWSFPLAEGQGPLFVAVQIWRRYVNQILTPPVLSGVPVPKTFEESKQILAGHSDQLHHRIGELVSLIGLSGPEADSLSGLAETRLQFLLSDGEGVTEERERSVWFRDSLDVSDSDRVLVGSTPHDEVWTSRGSVDSFVSTGPLQSAARKVRSAINRAVGRTWL
jgi:energy-coupling factor transporter ATP-binding protein EcfA2